jgi:hypothetical protein
LSIFLKKRASLGRALPVFEKSFVLIIGMMVVMQLIRNSHTAPRYNLREKGK